MWPLPGRGEDRRAPLVDDDKDSLGNLLAAAHCKAPLEPVVAAAASRPAGLRSKVQRQHLRVQVTAQLRRLVYFQQVGSGIGSTAGPAAFSPLFVCQSVSILELLGPTHSTRTPQALRLLPFQKGGAAWLPAHRQTKRWGH